MGNISRLILYFQGRTVEVTLIEIMEVLETFYVKLESESVVVASLSNFCPYFSKLLDQKMKFSSKITIKSEKVVTQLFTSMESLNNVIYDDELLSKFELVLLKTLTGSRKQLRNRVAQFWNRTFGKESGLKYPSGLKEVLAKNQIKLSLLLPGLKDAPMSSRMEGASFMDDTAQFPESLSSQSGIASPKLKNVSNPTHASPVKIHGSFLGLSKKSPKRLGSPSNVLGNFLASGSSKNSPKSPFKNSPSSAKNVRRKLPISMEDSCDFVEIKDSPATAKKKRLLTEHQKEMRRERKELPVMYNTLDQSQDASLMRFGASQDMTQMSQDNFFKLPEKPPVQIDVVGGDETSKREDGVTLKDDEKIESPLPLVDTIDDDDTNASNNLGTKLISKHNTKNEQDIEEAKVNTSDIIPSSQTQQDTTSSSSLSGDSQTHSKKRRKSMLKSKTKDTALVGLSQITPADVKTEEDDVDGDSQKDEIVVEVDDSNIVLLSEDVELFDAPKVKQPVVLDTPSDDDQPPQSSIDMEAKIVIDKLPNKRKRTLPTARRTGQKKRRTETGSGESTSKENRTPATKTKRGRQNSIAGTRATLDKQTICGADDVFDLSEELKNQEKVVYDEVEVKPFRSQRRAGRLSKEKRKSVPASFKTNTRASTAIEVEDKKKENHAFEDKKKDVSVRPVPQLDNLITVSNTIDSDDDDKPLKSVVDNKKTENLIDSQEKNLDDEILAMDVEAVKTKTQKSEGDEVTKEATNVKKDKVKSSLPKPQLCVTSSPTTTSLSSPFHKKSVTVSTPLSRSISSVSSPSARNRVHVSSPLSRNVLSVSSPLSRNNDVVLSSPVSSKQHNVCSRTSSPVSSKIMDNNKLVMRSPYVNYSTCIPTPALPGHLPSPCASPASSILKKRMGVFPNNDMLDSPSPPNKVSVNFLP